MSKPIYVEKLKDTRPLADKLISLRHHKLIPTEALIGYKGGPYLFMANFITEEGKHLNIAIRDDMYLEVR